MFVPSHPRAIEDWTLTELANLPTAESDLYEYKSGDMSLDELASKLARAASGFWNSGGGLFVAGVDRQGRLADGLPALVGRQDLRDWADQSLALVSPPGPYAVTVLRLDGTDRKNVEGDSVVLLVGFGISHTAPHMAPDRRYYIRAGAHTVPATHFLVEAIRSSRGLQQPWLECLLRHVPVRDGVAVQMSVVAVNDSPALDVRITAEPIEGRPAGYSLDLFPKRIPLIDRLHPFVMNLNSARALEDAAFLVLLSYQDIRGRKHSASCVVDAREQLGPAML